MSKQRQSSRIMKIQAIPDVEKSGIHRRDGIKRKASTVAPNKAKKSKDEDATSKKISIERENMKPEISTADECILQNSNTCQLSNLKLNFKPPVFNSLSQPHLGKEMQSSINQLLRMWQPPLKINKDNLDSENCKQKTLHLKDGVVNCASNIEGNDKKNTGSLQDTISSGIVDQEIHQSISTPNKENIKTKENQLLTQNDVHNPSTCEMNNENTNIVIPILAYKDNRKDPYISYINDMQCKTDQVPSSTVNSHGQQEKEPEQSTFQQNDFHARTTQMTTSINTSASNVKAVDESANAQNRKLDLKETSELSTSIQPCKDICNENNTTNKIQSPLMKAVTPEKNLLPSTPPTPPTVKIKINNGCIIYSSPQKNPNIINGNENETPLVLGDKYMSTVLEEISTAQNLHKPTTHLENYSTKEEEYQVLNTTNNKNETKDIQKDQSQSICKTNRIEKQQISNDEIVNEYFILKTIQSATGRPMANANSTQKQGREVSLEPISVSKTYEIEDFNITNSQLASIEDKCKQDNLLNYEVHNTPSVIPEVSTSSCSEAFLPKMPQMNWLQKMQDNRTKLRLVIQEISRLNAMLTRVRREVWPPKKPAH